jgi:hypothetical protein
MRYLMKRGKGALRRTVHLTPSDPFGNPTMEPLCGRHTVDFNMTSNVPWGRPLCKRCRALYNELVSVSR